MNENDLWRALGHLEKGNWAGREFPKALSAAGEIEALSAALRK